MSDINDQVNDQENVSDNQPCCDGGDCCPSGSDSGGKSWKMIVFIVIVVAAGAVLAHSIVNKSKSDADQSQPEFAAFQIDNGADAPTLPKAIEKLEGPVKSEVKVEKLEEPVKSEATAITTVQAVEPKKQDVSVKAVASIWKADLDSLASLNKLAADADAVFVLLAGKPPLSDLAIMKEIEAAAQKIMADKTKVSAFRLKESAPEFADIAKQSSVPCVLAMVKGLGMSVVSGDITETKLVQAFVAASRPSGGCCPPGAGASECK
jgi:hypothetical protein